MRMTDFHDMDYAVLLGCDRLDVSGGILVEGDGGQVPPNAHNRRILIGLGGAGVRTISRIRDAASRKLTPEWRQYTAFLAIDSDWQELKSWKPWEAVCITKPGAAQRAANPGTWPDSWRAYADPEQVRHMPPFGWAGCGRSRLMGKMKIHDREPELPGTDEEIVRKLLRARQELLPAAVNEFYDIYVIGNICGGTCGGGFLELPALIRRAMGPHNVRIHAVLYLPDTMSALNPGVRGELEASGYASLKELNYYQGLAMREGYREAWVCSDPAQPVLTMDADQGFFDMPFLVGTACGPTPKGLDIAMDTVVDFFVSILGDAQVNGAGIPVLDDFLAAVPPHRSVKNSDPAEPEQEAYDQLHEFPKHFGAVGFAAAAVPEELLRAWVVGRVCDAAGLKGADPVARTAMIAEGVANLPFMAETDLMTAKEGTEKALALLRPILEFMQTYQQERFDFLKFLGVPNVTFQEIRANTYYDALLRVNRHVDEKTGPSMREELNQKLSAAFARFRGNVEAFVTDYGPMAFWNLYMGRFIPENGYPGAGIRQMLKNLVEDRHPETGRAYSWCTSEQAKLELDRKYREICEANILNPFLRRQDMANAWLAAVNYWVSIRVNERLREHVLGKFHALERNVAEPAAILAEELMAFGRILKTLTVTYQRLGSSLDSYDSFREYSRSHDRINIAGLNTAAYDRLRNETETMAQNISGRRVRDALVRSFFNDSARWMEVPDGVVQYLGSGAIKLTNPQIAVPARRVFDCCMRENIQLDIHVTVEELFREANLRGVSYQQYAWDVMNSLFRRSRPLLHGDIANGMIHHYITYPAGLDPVIVNDLWVAANSLGIPFQLCAAADTETIAMYQLAAPFEIYRLRDLEMWEWMYEDQMRRNRNLHGKSPDLMRYEDEEGVEHFREMTSWYDYPAIAFRRDPTREDPKTGKRCHEGEVRLEIDKLLDRTRKLGVLYSQQDSNRNWQFFRVSFDKNRDWRFEMERLYPNWATGLLPTGKDLMEQIAAQNHSNIYELSRPVFLRQGGLMETPRSSEELAWTYAKRVLYAHRPMLIEIRETVAMMEKWSAAVEEFNTCIEKRWVPAKLIRIMKSHLIYRDDNDVWRNDDAGTILVNLSSMMLSRLRFQNPEEAALIDKGFELFAVHRILSSRGEKEYHQLIDDLLPKAQQVIMAFQDPELLQNTFDRIQEMLARECAVLENYGADISNPERVPAPGFVAAMEELGIPGEILPEMCRFYYYANL